MELIPKVARIVGPMIFGIILAEMFLMAYNQIQEKRKIKLTREESRNDVAGMFEFVALKALLPLYVIDSIMKSPISAKLMLVFAIGFMIPLAVYLISSIYHKVTKGTKLNLSRFNSFRLLISSFGGGNRGTIFVMVLFSLTFALSSHI